jgi:hypothetical protein
VNAPVKIIVRGGSGDHFSVYRSDLLPCFSIKLDPKLTTNNAFFSEMYEFLPEHPVAASATNRTRMIANDLFITFFIKNPPLDFLKLMRRNDH